MDVKIHQCRLIWLQWLTIRPEGTPFRVGVRFFLSGLIFPIMTAILYIVPYLYVLVKRCFSCVCGVIHITAHYQLQLFMCCFFSFSGQKQEIKGLAASSVTVFLVIELKSNHGGWGTGQYKKKFHSYHVQQSCESGFYSNNYQNKNISKFHYTMLDSL